MQRNQDELLETLIATLNREQKGENCARLIARLQKIGVWKEGKLLHFKILLINFIKKISKGTCN